MELVSFLGVGVGVGLLGSLLGIGGGMVIVPLLVFAYGYEPQLAIGTSVLVVLLNAVSGTLGYIRQRRVCVDAAVKFALATIPGAFLGSYAAEYLQGKIFFWVFGIFSCWQRLICIARQIRAASKIWRTRCRSNIIGSWA